MTGKTQYGPVVNGIGWYVLPSGEKKYRVVQKVPGRRKTINKGGFTTKGAAKHWLRETMNRLHDGTHVSAADARETFGPFAHRWFENYKLGIGVKRKPKPTTIYRYEGVLRGQILPYFETTQFRDLDLDAVERWLAQLAKRPARTRSGNLRQSTIIKAYRLLKQILDSAVQKRHLTGNPCTLSFETEKPDTAKYEDIAEPNLVRALADHMRDEVWWDERGYRHHRRHAKYRALILLAGFGGPRWGEAIGLQRRHVDLNAGTVKVRGQVILLAGSPPQFVSYTKSEAGRRTVHLPSEVVDGLRHHLENHVGPGPDALLFPARPRSGKISYLRASNWRRSVWLPAVEAVGADAYTADGLVFHDLRHVAGTLAAQAGAPIKDLMQRLGHASEAAALRYQHSTEATQKALAARLDALLSLPSEQATGTDDATVSNVVPLRRPE